MNQTADIVKGKVVLVTGGTGSFGRHFVAHLLEQGDPRAVRVFSRDELKQSDMAQAFPDDRLRFLIGDVRDEARLHRAMRGVDLVVHAAALKQVPACEYNPFEAVQTNIIGTQNVATACLDAGVARAVALSTDKAMSPANLYGATKLCAEKLFIHSNVYAGDRAVRFACVRYGNVVGSRGSVVPLFLAQRSLGELTITDERMTRFWISLDQAVGLVLLALTQMAGGEVFVPKIPSMRMVDLAAVMAPDAQVRFTGIRPGEKLHEVLITSEESRNVYEYDDHFVVRPLVSHAAWDPGEDGRRVAEGFAYQSDRNTDWLDADRLRALVAGHSTVEVVAGRGQEASASSLVKG